MKASTPAVAPIKFRDDVEYASAYGVSDVVPVLVDGAFRHVQKIPVR